MCCGNKYLIIVCHITRWEGNNNEKWGIELCTNGVQCGVVKWGKINTKCLEIRQLYRVVIRYSYGLCLIVYLVKHLSSYVRLIILC